MGQHITTRLCKKKKTCRTASTGTLQEFLFEETENTGDSIVIHYFDKLIDKLKFKDLPER